MKGKRVGKLAFIIVFFIVCIVPVACMGRMSQQLSENRTLSEWPQWTLEEGGFNTDFFNQVQTYIAEHFAFRSDLVELDSLMKYELLHSPSDTQVILGKGDWLFFDATLDDYAGVTLPQEEIDEIAAKLAKVCAYIRECGKEPLILLVPNKNTVYSEYMPSRFGTHADTTNRTLLQEAMEQEGVPFLDAGTILYEAKEGQEVYLHQDTHWNHTGARIVLNEVYEAFGLDESQRHSLGDYRIEATHEPDLYQILFPAKEYYEEQHVYDPQKEFSYIGRVRSMDDLEISTVCDAEKSGKILVYRDSFGRAMIPNMAEIFSECTFVRSTPYDLSQVEEIQCDYVLIEIVERNIADLGDLEIPQ